MNADLVLAVVAVYGAVLSTLNYLARKASRAGGCQGEDLEWALRLRTAARQPSDLRGDGERGRATGGALVHRAQPSS